MKTFFNVEDLGDLKAALDQRAIEAKELYDKGLKLIEIAKELDVPVGTVRS